MLSDARLLEGEWTSQERHDRDGCNVQYEERSSSRIYRRPLSASLSVEDFYSNARDERRQRATLCARYSLLVRTNRNRLPIVTLVLSISFFIYSSLCHGLLRCRSYKRGNSSWIHPLFRCIVIFSNRI